MFKKVISFFLYCLVFSLMACHEGAKNKKIVYTAISDSLYKPDSLYTQNYLQWKNLYQECMGYQLFRNAFYMGLQDMVNVGSIDNRSAINVNGKTGILDTTYSERLFQLFASISTSNCYSKINLTPDLQHIFLSELRSILNQSKQYQWLDESIDTTQIIFRVTTLSDNSIRPDSLVTLLQTTKDTSLLRFKELLLTPGNVLLVHVALIFGFDCEFAVSKKLSATEEEKFTNEVFFNWGNNRESGSIKLLPDQHLKIYITKYYTVFGEFYAFKEVEN